jgi:phage I-like protein
MKTDTSLLNHAPFDAAKSLWMHVCPLGEHVWTSADGTEKITQVIDRVGCEQMAASYPLSGPLSRVDVDHKSMDPDNTTEASGWGKAAEVREDGLWVRSELTTHGAPLVNGKVYQYTSPCFPRAGLVDLGGGRMRVTQLGVIALTNDPNLGGQTPLTNSRAKSANPTNTNTPKTMDYKAMLLKALGLPPEATDDQITAAIAAQASTAATQNSRVKDLETQLTNRDLDEHGIKDVEQRKLLAPMLANTATRDTTLALIKGSKPAEARTPLHNRAGGKTPEVIKKLTTEEDAENQADAEVTDLHNRARRYRDQNKVGYELALGAVRAGADA